MFNKILIANRGEIALRIVRACREMGIKSVAVYSEADRDSLHVRYADEAICIGPAESAKSYLHIPSIIATAEITDAEAIHPGYGFLAENDNFAEVCNSCGITFIGPCAETIRMAGDKSCARKIAQEAGVPVVPGSKGTMPSLEEARVVAGEIGYPVIIKATAGGGGRGMRVAHTPASFDHLFHAAQAEAQGAFSNPDVYIEKYIERPRHVEVQLIADKHGNVIHLGERDCSVQRRHQKLVEESPSPAVNDALRKELGDAAIKFAKAVNYDTAGTVEFLLDEDGNYYFIEMNTRIQVEHTVTEMVSGVDLIRAQILSAAGKTLAESIGGKPELRGYAIECRINAEDPDSFLPSPGEITAYSPPGGLGIRLDSCAYTGCTISPYYDSMIAKLIAWGDDRETAIRRMLRALDEFVIEGISCNIPLLKDILEHPHFRQGNVDTHFIERIKGA